MSTDFEERIARLNAKNGVTSPAPRLPASTHSRKSGGNALARDKGLKGSIGKYILLGLIVLVIMPIGAAMGTIYLAQTKETLANINASVDSQKTQSE